MASDLAFTKSGNVEIATFTSEGPTVVQIEREANGYLTIYAHFSDMPKASVYCSSDGTQHIFEIDIPVGLTVTIESVSHVKKAKMGTV